MGLPLAGVASARRDPGHNERIYGAHMTAAEEVPGPGAGEGWAWISVKEDQNKICWVISSSGTDTPTAAHIHVGPRGVAGPIVVPLTPPSGGTSEGCWSGDNKDIIRAILNNPSDYYVNVHTAKYPAGAMRGQLEFPAPSPS
jgi:hypothetical protein